MRDHSPKGRALRRIDPVMTGGCAVPITRAVMVTITWMTVAAMVLFWRIVIDVAVGDWGSEDIEATCLEWFWTSALLGGAMSTIYLACRMATMRLGWRMYGWAPSIAVASLIVHALAVRIDAPVPYGPSIVISIFFMIPNRSMLSDEA